MRTVGLRLSALYSPSSKEVTMVTRSGNSIAKAAFALLLGAVALPSCGAQTSLPLVTPISADAFVDSMGINVHLHNGTMLYGNFPVILSALHDLGIRHTRDGLINTTWEEYYKRHATLAAAGIHCLFITGPEDTDAQLIRFTQKTAGAVEGFEAPNEFDRTGGPDWAAILSAYMPRLRKAAALVPPKGTATIVGPALTSMEAYARVPNLASTFDEANMHNYFGGRHPGTPGWGDNGYGSIVWNLNLTRRIWGSKPIVTTETGYLTDVKAGQAVTEQVAADYIPRVFLEQKLHGIVRTYLYELADGDESVNQAERSFGLLRADGTRKPAFSTVQRMVRLFADPGAAATLTPVRLQVSADSADVHSMLLQKRDGRLLLAYWLEVSGFDPMTRKPVSSLPVAVRLRAGTEMSDARAYSLDPAQTSTGVSLGSHAELSLKATPTVSVVEFRLKNK